MITLNTQPLTQGHPTSHTRQVSPGQAIPSPISTPSSLRFSGNDNQPGFWSRAYAWLTNGKAEKNLKATILKPHYDDTMAMTLSEDQAKRVSEFGKTAINLTLTPEQSDKIANFGSNTLIRLGKQVFAPETSKHIANWGSDTVNQVRLRVLSPEASNEIASWFSDTANQARIQILSPEASQQISNWVGDTFEKTRHKVLNTEASEDIGKFVSDVTNKAVAGSKEPISLAATNMVQDSTARLLNDGLRHCRRIALQNTEALRKLGYGAGMAATGYYILPYVTSPLKSNTVTIGGFGLMGVGVQEFKNNFGKQTDRTQASAIALSQAAKEGDVHKLEDCIKNKVNINELDPEGCSALYRAAEYGQEKAAQFLIDHGADVQQKSTDLERTPLWIASQNGHIEIVHRLLNAHAAVNQPDINGITPFQIAKAFGNKSIASSLRSAGAINIPSSTEQQSTLEPKLLASSLDRDPKKVDQLSLAAKENDLPKLKKMLQQGIDYNGLDSKGCTPLYKAAQEGSKQTLQFLLNIGANKDLGQPQESKTPLWGAIRNGHLAIVQELIKHGADLDIPSSKSNQTPLWIAASLGHTSIVKELIKHGADLNKAESHGKWTPLRIALERKRDDIAVALIEAGADPSFFNISPLHWAIDNKRIEVAKAFIKKREGLENTDKENRLGTPLNLAAYRGEAEIVEALINANVELNSRDIYGWTPLSNAVRHHHLKIETALLDAGAIE